MKITMYELLGMVKDDKAPKKIKYKDKIYYYHKGYDFDYLYNSSTSSPLDKEKSLFKFSSYISKGSLQYFYDRVAIEFLNNEVEIIEEEKKILDEININLAYIDKEYLLDKEDVDRKINEIINRHNILVDKVDEIIDYLKSKGE